MTNHQNFIARFCGVFLFVVLAASLVMLTIPALGSTDQFPALLSEEILTFSLTDDASLISAYPTTNYGAAATLEVDNSPVKNILIKTSLSGIDGRLVTRAVLRLYSVGSSDKGGDFYIVPTNDWDEHSVTWDNAPAAGPTLVYSLGRVSPSIWYEADLTSAISGDGTYSFRIVSTTTDGADYSSRESSYPAQLIVTVSNIFTDTPSSTPTDWPFPVTPTDTPEPTSTPTITLTPTPSMTPTRRFTPTLLPTIAPPEPGTLRFAVFSDPGGYNDREVADVINLIKSWNVEFIVTAGDNNPCTSADWDSCVGSNFHDFIYPYTGVFGSGAEVNKMWPAMGNHDWNADVLGWNAFFTLPNNERYYSISYGPVRVFIIDSDSREPDGTTLASIQGQWFENAIAAAAEPWKLVSFHYPPYSSGAVHGSSTRMRWGFENYGVSAVFSGHDHIYERSFANDVTYFVVGTGGDSLYLFSTPIPESIVRYNSDYGAMLVEASECRIDYKFITRTNLLIDSYTQMNPGCAPVQTPTQTETLPSTETATPSVTSSEPPPTQTDTPTTEPTQTDTPTIPPTLTRTVTSTQTSTPVPSPTFTATDTPTPQVTPSGNPVYVVLQNPGPTTIGNLSGITNSDILYFDGAGWQLKFDGSDLGLSVPISAFSIIDANTVILALGKSVNLPPVGKVTLQDIVKFTGVLGPATSGTFSMYFDGSDVGLDKLQESILSLERLADGRLIIGTKGAASAPGVSTALEDVLIFSPTLLGTETSGTWGLYIDGSDIGLTGTARIDALAVGTDGDIYISTAGIFTLGGITGDGGDVVVCSPTSLGAETICSFHPELYFDGSTWGLSDDNVNGISMP